MYLICACKHIFENYLAAKVDHHTNLTSALYLVILMHNYACAYKRIMKDAAPLSWISIISIFVMKSLHLPSPPFTYLRLPSRPSTSLHPPSSPYIHLPSPPCMHLSSPPCTSFNLPSHPLALPSRLPFTLSPSTSLHSRPSTSLHSSPSNSLNSSLISRYPSTTYSPSFFPSTCLPSP